MFGKIKRLRNIQEFELSGFELFGLNCNSYESGVFSNFILQ